MSVYNKAWLFTGWTLLFFATAPIWLSAAVERWGLAAAVLAIVYGFAHWAAVAWAFPCPRCGRSVYKISKRLIGVYVPCPASRCRCCGFRLEPSKQG